MFALHAMAEKVSKKNQLAYLIRLREGIEGVGGLELNDEQKSYIDSLILSHFPSPKRKPKSIREWVLRAHDETCAVTILQTSLCAFDDNIYATDGYVIHKAQCRIPDNLYKIDGTGLHEDRERFESCKNIYMKVFAPFEDNLGRFAEHEVFDEEVLNIHSYAFAARIHLIGGEESPNLAYKIGNGYFNKQFFDTAAAQQGTIEVKIAQDGSRLYGRHDLGEFIIAGMNP